MKNIIEILKAYGIELTDEQKTTLTKEVAENYKSIAEHEKKLSKIETELANTISERDTAKETLLKFDGIDTDKITGELETYKNKVSELEATHKKELYTRDFEDVLSKSIEKYKFSSELAKEAIINKIKSEDLKLTDGRILGLDDYVSMIKEKDSTAFVDEKMDEMEKSKAKYSDPLNKQKDGVKYTTADIMKMKNANPDLDISQFVK